MRSSIRKAVHTDYAYNPSTLRLERLTTNDGRVADLEYEFDNVGNIQDHYDSRNTGRKALHTMT